MSRDLPPAPRAPDAPLDELLRFEDAGPRLPVVEARRPWILRSLVYSFLWSAVMYSAFHIVDLDPPYPLILAMCAGGVLVRRAVAASSEVTWQRTRDAVRPPAALRRIDEGGWYAGGDGMLGSVRRWDRRLDWGSGGPERFDATVSVRLGELADERLRLRHSITRASDPARARNLLGEDVWAALHGPSARVPGPRQVAAVVTRLESL